MKNDFLGETVVEIVITSIIAILFAFFLYITIDYISDIFQYYYGHMSIKVVTLAVLPLQITCSFFIAIASIVLFILAKITSESVLVNNKLQLFFKIFGIVVFILTIGLDVFVFIVKDYFSFA